MSVKNSLPFAAGWRWHLVCCGALGACATEQDERLDLSVIAGCESQFHSDCDVLEAECQERVFATMACLRDMPDARMPETRTITLEEYRAELAAPPDASDAEADAANEPSDNTSVEHAFVLLGLAQPADLSEQSFVNLYADSVPAYYSNAEQRVTFIEDPSERENPGDLTALLAHEFSHALQYQDIPDLVALREDEASFDEFLAELSVVEGEASMFESFFTAAMWGLEGDIDFRNRYTVWVPDSEQRFGAQSPLLVGPRYFPYSFGARYVFDVYNRGEVDAVRGIYADMPSSVLPMLIDPEAAADVSAQPAPLVAPAPLEGFELISEDTLGPWVFGRFLQRALSQTAFDQLMTRWRGDRVFIYARGASSVTVIWSIELDGAPSVDQFTTLMIGRGNDNLARGAYAVTSGPVVAVAVSDDTSSQTAWTASITTAQTSPDSSSMAAAPPRRGAPLPASLRRRLAALLELPAP